MRKTVLIVGEYGSINGGENSLLSILPQLIEFGWQFQAAVPENSPLADRFKSLGFRIHDLSITDQVGVRMTQAEIRARLSDIITRVQPALVHCNSLSTSRICGPVTHELKTPSLGYLRDILKLSKKAIQDINQMDRLIAVSTATKNWHVEQGLESEKTTVIYNGIDAERFAPPKELDELSRETETSVRVRLGIGSDSPVLLFVGQIGIRKGVDVLLDSFLNLCESCKTQNKLPPHLIIVGQRHSLKQEAIDYEKQLQLTANQSEFSDQIHWVGRRNDVPDLMRTATVLVHPARQEPLGRVLLEAAASGLPIATTSVGGSPEILADENISQLMVPPNDPAALSNLLHRLVCERGAHQNRRQIASRLRQIALSKFSNSLCAETVHSHYVKLVGD
ncbi:MAG: glycosyltransferase family 4 protein [Mariniblastus sp.]